jgi:hypothetical protein
MQGHYKLVFDVGARSAHLPDWMLPLFILPCIGLLLVVIPKNVIDKFLTRGLKGVPAKVFSWIFFLITSFLAATFLFTYLDREGYYRSIEKAGQTSVVEGCLQYFHRMPEDEHGLERIQVNGRVFSYSDATVTSAFNNTESHGGPIHPDTKVRLTTAGDNIIRVEVQQKACPAAPEFPTGFASS